MDNCFIEKFLYRREDVLDVEVFASGFTRDMEKDLLTSMGIDDELPVDDDRVITECDESKQDIMRLVLESKASEEERFYEPTDSVEEFIDANDKLDRTMGNEESVKMPELVNANFECLNNLKDLKIDISSEFDGVSEDGRSNVTGMSTASTIPAEVVRDKVKKALERRHRNEARHRVIVKGEANAVTRKRRENRDTIKEHAVWDWS